MKVRLNGAENRKPYFERNGKRLTDFITTYNLRNRLVTLTLIAALLVPFLFFGQMRTASAHTASAVSQIPAHVSPPEAFVLSSLSLSSLPGSLSRIITSSAPKPIIALDAFAASGYSSVSSYFIRPGVPNGFALAQPASPFAASVSSVASSIGAFFGLALPSAKPVNTSISSATARLSTSNAAAAPASAAALLSQPAGSVQFDFDGDGKADIARWHPATKEWKVKLSTTGAYTTQTIGTSSSAILAPGDFDGDHKTDSTIFNAGTWTINKSASSTTTTVTFGQAGDIPVIGDYDGDGTSDIAVFRPSSATWIILNSSNSTTTTTQFGAAGDIPVAGHYDSDNKTDIAVYRPSTGYWYVQGSTAGFSSTQWGVSGDVPVPADYDGDGTTDKAVFRSSVGTWYLYQSTNGTQSLSWGNYGDQPVPADYDGDGKADLAVWRPSTGVWHIINSSTGAYAPQTLGAPGDTAIESAYLKQIGSQVYSYDFAKTRLSPKNAMGDTDLYSRNFSWSSGLVNLPGRTGLDLGLGISYNSLVWTKSDTTMVFDADQSNVSPGFRFGFPVIEPVYLDGTTGKFNYLMVTPSGAKVQFKQTTATNIFETADSTYAQLVLNRLGASPSDPVETQNITVTTTDGTMMSYAWIGNAFRCTQIKDRNGNYITIYNDDYGLLRTVTDTLGRVVTVNYDTDNFPISITQDWKDNNGQGTTQTHTYATFNYGNVTMYPQFNSTSVTSIYGPATGTIKVLQSIVYPGGSSTHFDYNVYGQVYKVSNYAADNHELNHTLLDLSSYDLPAGVQTDCPRFSQTTNSVENFNNNQDVIVHNLVTENAPYSVPGASGTATQIKVWMDNEPNNHRTKTYVGSAGWQEGLPIATEDCISDACTGTDRKRWTWTNWTQDDTTKDYIINPRVTETKVGDGTNTKRTTISYLPVSQGSPVALYGLTSEVDVYDADQSTVLKKNKITYNLDNAYVSRRIIGLTATNLLTDGNDALLSKVTYGYDGGSFTGTGQNLTSVIQHDHASRGYGSTFVIGRGNPTSTIRWDVNDPLDSSKAVTSNIKYNTAGGVVSQTDPLNRTVGISYADLFNDGNNTRNTFAYPTTITDPANFSSQVKYRYDTGANVWAKSPDLNASISGKQSTREFDTSGRLLKQAIWKDAAEYAYTRYVYPNNGNQFQAYSTVTAGLGEAVSESWFDGAGRVIKSRNELPNGTATGTYSGVKTAYDILGQVSGQSVPTEVDANWNLAGDDAIRGTWLWKYTKYDWKGRVTRQINTDGVDSPTNNDSDVLISYDGCGCAGGQVTTIEGENIIEKDWQGNNPTSLGRRKQIITADILGRTVKTQIMNWNGTTPYTTTINTYNGRDQVTSSRQFVGAESNPPSTPPSGKVFQDTTMSYDGHGRLVAQRVPQQDAATSYNYNLDDSIQSVVDARGASTNYTYNSRGLVAGVSYNAPSPNPSAIPVPSPVSFDYDNAGNRKLMTDGLGTVTYSYNELSQLKDETRTFTDNSTTPPLSLPNAPLSGNSFKLEYTYDLSGQLKSLKDPYGQQINYEYDKTGKLNSVAGAASFGTITTYASAPQYRAWGGLKSLSYGNQTQMSMTFNDRLEASHYEYDKIGQSTPIMAKDYDYYKDGSLRKLDDTVDDVFDRLNTYDNMGRPSTGKTGAEARGGSVTQQYMQGQLPYRQDYTFNEFNNLTARNNLHWGIDTFQNHSNNLSYTYQNNRITDPYNTRQYDADGRMLESTNYDDGGTYVYDAGGQLTQFTDLDTGNGYYSYLDGNGQEAKHRKLTDDGTGTVEEIKYYIRSSVLRGAVVSEADSTGRKLKTIVRAAGEELAWQTVYHDTTNNTDSEYVNFQQLDASGFSYRSTTTSGDAMTAQGTDGAPAELDPLGGNVGVSSPYIFLNGGRAGYPHNPALPTLRTFDLFESPMTVNGQRVTATVDGIDENVSVAISELQRGAAVQCPNNYCGPQVITVNGQSTITSLFTAYNNGTSGYWYHTWGRVGVYTDEEHPRLESQGEWGITGTFFTDAQGGDSLFNLNFFGLPEKLSPPIGDRGIGTSNTSNSNPCAGHTLNYNAGGDTGWNHIVDRHIDQTIDYVGKSVYGRSPITTPTLGIRKARVEAINNLTFNNGGLTVQTDSRGRNTYVYVYGLEKDFKLIKLFAVGIDNETPGHQGQYTNLNTLVVGDNCDTVITSHPGLPSTRLTPNPTVNGPRRWWTPTRVLPF